MAYDVSKRAGQGEGNVICLDTREQRPYGRARVWIVGRSYLRTSILAQRDQVAEFERAARFADRH